MMRIGRWLSGVSVPKGRKVGIATKPFSKIRHLDSLTWYEFILKRLPNTIHLSYKAAFADGKQRRCYQS